MRKVTIAAAMALFGLTACQKAETPAAEAPTEAAATEAAATDAATGTVADDASATATDEAKAGDGAGTFHALIQNGRDTGGGDKRPDAADEDERADHSSVSCMGAGAG